MDVTTRAAIEKAAAIKTIKGATARLDAGEYPVDVTVRIHGTIKKGEPYAQTIWPSVNLLAVLTRLLNVAGRVQRAAFEDAVRAVMSGEDDILADADGNPINLKAWTEETVKRLAEAGETICTGKTTAKLDVEVVGAEPYAVEAETETANV